MPMLEVEALNRPPSIKFEKGPQVDKERIRVNGKIYKEEKFPVIRTSRGLTSDSGYRSKYILPEGLLKAEFFISKRQNGEWWPTNGSREYELWLEIDEEDKPFFQPILEHGHFSFKYGPSLDTGYGDYVLVPLLEFADLDARTPEMREQAYELAGKYKLDDWGERQWKPLKDGGFVIHDYPHFH